MPVKYSNSDKSYAIIGAAMAVHQELGNGFLEKVYHLALNIEFRERDIPFQHEVELPIYYSGIKLDCAYRADFICYGEIILELKAIKDLTSNETSQIINYLNATNLDIGLLINFATPSLQYERYNNSKKK